MINPTLLQLCATQCHSCLQPSTRLWVPHWRRVTINLMHHSSLSPDCLHVPLYLGPLLAPGVLGTQANPHKHLVSPVYSPQRLKCHDTSSLSLSSSLSCHLRPHCNAPHFAEARRPWGALTHTAVTCALPVQNLCTGMSDCLNITANIFLR